MKRFLLAGFSLAFLIGTMLPSQAFAQLGATVPNWSVAQTDSSGTKGAHAGMTTQADIGFGGTALIPVTPCRVVDTRGAVGTFGGPSMVAGSPRNFPLPTGPCTGLPSAIRAYSLNITATNTSGPGFFKVYPQGFAAPVVSTLNYASALPPGIAVANAAIVPGGTSSGITVVASTSADLIIDINGYFQGNGSLAPLNPNEYVGWQGNNAGGPVTFGWNTAATGFGVWGRGNDTGVFGLSDAATGIHYGVLGSAGSPTSGAASVAGTSGGGAPNANYTTFLSSGGIGVEGLNTGNYGVVGISSFIAGKFFALNTSGTQLSVAYLGESFDAARFYGDVSVNALGAMPGDLSVAGTLSKGAGAFKIDDPIDPENKYLYHSFVESPDMMNIYNGNVVLDRNGEAIVQLPAWFESLNMDYRYQLTSIGRFSAVYVADEIQDNQFRIAGGRPGAKVSWQVTGIRHDAFANAHRIPVEIEKEEAAKGFYLHPAEHGKGPEMDLGPRIRKVSAAEEGKDADNQ